MLAYKRPKLNEYSPALTPNGLPKDWTLSPKKNQNRKRKQAISARFHIHRAYEDRLVLCVLLYRASMETLSCLEDDHSNLNKKKPRMRIGAGENEMEDAWSVKRWKCRGMNQDAIPFSWYRTT